MNCPHCNKQMDLEEWENNWVDFDHLEVANHWWCSYCNRIYTQNVSYQKIAEEWLENEESNS